MGVGDHRHDLLDGPAHPRGQWSGAGHAKIPPEGATARRASRGKHAAATAIEALAAARRRRAVRRGRRPGSRCGARGRRAKRPSVERPDDTLAVAAWARDVRDGDRARPGFEPTDRKLDKLGYDIESRDPATGRLRFIEVKGTQERRRHGHRHEERDPVLACSAAAATPTLRACATSGGRSSGNRTSGRRASTTRSRTCWPPPRTRGRAGGSPGPGVA